METSPDSKALCSALDRFGLPRAIAHAGADAFIAWNHTFLERTGFSAEAIRTVGINKRLTLAQPVQEKIGVLEGLPDNVEIAPCVLSCPSKKGFVTGHAVKNAEGYLFLMLDVSDPTADVFAHGQTLGRKQEQDRIRRLLHDALSPQLLVALFAIAGAEAKAEEEGHAEAKDLARAMRALEEGIDNIVRALEKPR
ncbi:MAG: hypothetical protein WB586_01475 [Chthoniobacterales bacterium]